MLGALANAGIAFHTFKDQAIFERDEVLTKAGQPYTVFTPYKRAWLAKVDDFYLKPYPARGYADALRAAARTATCARVPGAGGHRLRADQPRRARDPDRHAAAAPRCSTTSSQRIERYHGTRDYPAVRGPSYLSVHLRFGTVSIRAAGRRWRTGWRCRATPARRPGWAN